MKKTGTAAILIVVILFASSFLKLVNAFVPEGTVKSANNFDTSNSAVYKSTKLATEKFYESIKQKMEEEKEKLIEDNTVESTITDADGNVTTIKECKISITKKLNYVGDSYLIAYLSMKGGLDSKTAKIDEKKALGFLNSICSVSVKNASEDEFEIENVFSTEEEISKKYFKSRAESTEYIASSKAYASYFNTNDVEVTVEVIDIHEVSGASESYLKVPLYLQYSGKWASTPYGDATIAKCGCCPTCLAMVFSYLNQENIYPDDITAWAGNKYYVSGAGTAWSIFEPAAEKWGANVRNIGKNERSLINELSEGHLVVASMGPGTFTKGGHFIVLTGITEDGKILVNDPNDSEKKKHKDIQFEISLILRESKNMWVFSAKE